MQYAYPGKSTPTVDLLIGPLTFPLMGFRPSLQCCALFQHSRLGPKSRHKSVDYPITAVPLLHQEAHLVWQVSSMALRSTVRKHC